MVIVRYSYGNRMIQLSLIGTDPIDGSTVVPKNTMVPKVKLLIPTRCRQTGSDPRYTWRGLTCRDPDLLNLRAVHTAEGRRNLSLVQGYLAHEKTPTPL